MNDDHGLTLAPERGTRTSARPEPSSAEEFRIYPPEVLIALRIFQAARLDPEGRRLFRLAMTRIAEGFDIQDQVDEQPS
jgi:hypothetical protein